MEAVKETWVLPCRMGEDARLGWLADRLVVVADGAHRN
jgi:hypothetical protein